MIDLKKNRVKVLVLLALFCTYFIWGSTYLAIRFGVESFPPFMMAGSRFAMAGLLLYGIMRMRGSPNPSRQEWLGAAAVGVLLLALGNGTVTYVQQTVSSSVAALSIATAPLWVAIFSSMFGHHPTKWEWIGIGVGMIGIVLLNMGDTLQGDPLHAALLIFAAATWSFGSIWGKYLAMPKGLMASATQMLAGGIVLLMFSMIQGETWPETISTKSWSAFIFLFIFGSMVAYSAYVYLLKTVRPAIASSNTFVNPVVAFVLGIWLANEQISALEYIALAVIVVGVCLVLFNYEELN